MGHGDAEQRNKRKDKRREKKKPGEGFKVNIE